MSTFQEPFAGTPYAATRRELGVDNSIPSGKASRGIISVEDGLFRIRDTDGTPLCPSRYATIGRCWNYVVQYNRLYPGGRDASSDIENGSLIEIKAQGQKQSILGYMSQNVNSWLDSKCFAQPRLTNRGNALLQREQLH